MLTEQAVSKEIRSRRWEFMGAFSMDAGLAIAGCPWVTVDLPCCLSKEKFGGLRIPVDFRVRAYRRACQIRVLGETRVPGRLGVHRDG